MIGKTISHYKILDKLGEGGMGVVYKAEDTKLKRTVALKFLPPELTRDGDAKGRLEHEAQAASALDHPNICTVHEIDETEDGRLFMVMAYYEGETLKHKIEGGPIATEKALKIATHIARGLARAHKRRITHRDIKPANIFITEEDETKILDFGLAKLSGRLRLTKTGSTVGTVAYMSPEQARGEEVDNRTDVWSLGVVLYEMVSGRLPFEGDHEQAVMYSIMNTDPAPPTSLRAGLPKELERIVFKCLEKDPLHRYQQMNDLVSDLEHLKLELKGFKTTTRRDNGSKPEKRSFISRLVGLAVVVVIFAVVVYYQFSRLSAPSNIKIPPERTKLAVLFFENLGPPEDGYFADGITDAITARLAAIRKLGVISRQSTIQYKDSKKSIRQIGEELGADYILQGTIQRERPNDPTSRVRIIPQLIYVSEDIHLWADTYDEEMTEVFHVQSTIAERVALAMDITLLEPERRTINAKPTDNLDAYEYYLQGKEHQTRAMYPEQASRASQLFEKAVGLDPDFAAAWTALSIMYIWRYYSEPMELIDISEHENLKAKARFVLDEAFRIDPDLPEAHMALGYYYYYGEEDYARALENFVKARDLQPSETEIIEAIALIKRRLNEWRESTALFESALELDPRNYKLNFCLAINLFDLHQFERAEFYLDRAISLNPEAEVTYKQKIDLYLNWDGDTKRARHVLKNYLKRFSPERMLDIASSQLIRIMPEAFTDILKPVGEGGHALQDTGAYYYAMGELKRRLKQPAFAYYDSARIHLEQKTPRVSVHSEYYHAFLGLVYAGLGKTEDAKREADTALTLRPVSEDPVEGPFIALRAAEIYVRIGEFDAAMDLIELLLSIPTEFTVNMLRLDPIWDPLRELPRFKKLLRENK